MTTNDDEHDAFMNRMHEIRLMIRDILLNPAPLEEQPDILRKIGILNLKEGIKQTNN